MKRCPKCRNTYNDPDLNFCLTDGEMLVADSSFDPNDSVQTVFMSPETTSNTTQTGNQGKNFFIFTTIALLLILLLGSVGFIAYLMFGNKTDVVANANVAKSLASENQNEPEKEEKTDNSSSENTQITMPKTETQKESAPNTSKTSSSKLYGLKRYRGSIGEESVTFNLDWKKDSTIVGNYYFASSPDYVFEVKGSNYADGKAALTVFDGSENVGKINLYKTLEGKNLCWQGTVSDRNRPPVSIRFCRTR